MTALRLCVATVVALLFGMAACSRATDPDATPAGNGAALAVPDTGPGAVPDQGSTPAEVMISAARIRAVIPGQDKTAAYLTVENRGSVAFVLTGVESARARAIEFHSIVRDGDMVSMRRLPELVVEPGATLQLAPGGLHLMVFGVVEPLEPFTATLVAADGQRFDVPFDVIALGGT